MTIINNAKFLRISSKIKPTILFKIVHGIEKKLIGIEILLSVLYPNYCILFEIF